MPTGFINNGMNNNLFGVDPMLEPLADNGGVCQTHALASTSPAIDNGSNPLKLKYDQRGPFCYFRVVGDGVDIGAFEFGNDIWIY
jgi:hypothetical protein